MFLRLPDGRTVAYAENGYRGELIEDSVTVERLQRAYDSVRDQGPALTFAAAGWSSFVAAVKEGDLNA